MRADGTGRGGHGESARSTEQVGAWSTFTRNLEVAAPMEPELPGLAVPRNEAVCELPAAPLPGTALSAHAAQPSQRAARPATLRAIRRRCARTLFRRAERADTFQGRPRQLCTNFAVNASPSPSS